MIEKNPTISCVEGAEKSAPSFFNVLKNILNTKNYIIDKKSDLYKLILSKTVFLPDKCPIKQRVWHILNGVYDIPTCKCCDKKVNWSGKTSYSTYCSASCRNKDPEFIATIKDESTKQKRRQTNLIRYGGVAPACSIAVIQKMKGTMLELYGVDNALKCEAIKNKQKETILNTYGVDNVSKLSEVKQKKKDTLFKNYGVTSVMDIPNFVRVSSEKLKSEEVVNKKIQTNRKKYNVDNYKQKHILPENLLLLNDRDWLYEQHITLQHNCAYIANLLGVDRHTVHGRLKKFDIRIKRYYRSAAEIEIYEYISKYLKCDHNVRNIVTNELDIYIPEKNVAIEYCGLYWHSEDFVGKDYHRKKFLECRSKNIRLIQIFEDEWLTKKQLVLDKLDYILGISNKQKIPARKCVIKEVSVHDKAKFFEQTHIQGDGPSSINYGLYYNSELVACIGFIKKSETTLILNRYATLYNVIGGFSKLLKQFSSYDIETFADLRWSTGKLYENNGFDNVQELKEDYFYCKSQYRYHKFGFRRKHLRNKLKIFDENLSEYQNCSNAGYYRIWDAGKIKYIKKAT